METWNSCLPGLPLLWHSYSFINQTLPFSWLESHFWHELALHGWHMKDLTWASLRSVLAFCVQVNGFWSAGAEESVMMSKRPAPLEWYLCFSGMIVAGYLGMTNPAGLTRDQSHWAEIFWKYFFGVSTELSSSGGRSMLHLKLAAKLRRVCKFWWQILQNSESTWATTSDHAAPVAVKTPELKESWR